MSAAASTRGNALLKSLDRWVGIPLVLLSAALRRPHALPSAPRRIAVLKTAAIGDTVLLAAAVAALAARYPAASVRVFLGASNRAMAPLLAVPSEVLPIARPWRARAALAAFAPDLLIDCEPWARLTALLVASAGGATLGFATARQHRHAAFDRAVPHSARCHEYRNYARLFAGAGVSVPALPSLPAPAQVEPPLPGRFALLHPWPGGYLSHLREWPAARWSELGSRLAAARLGIAVGGAQAEAERASRLLAQMPRGSISIAGRYGLADLAAIARAATVVVSVNTGIMHLAAAAGAAVVGLSGPTSVRRWGAIGARAVNVASDCDGCGFLNLGFEYAGQRADCMEHIAVERVWRAIQALGVLPA